MNYAITIAAIAIPPAIAYCCTRSTQTPNERKFEREQAYRNTLRCINEARDKLKFFVGENNPEVIGENNEINLDRLENLKNGFLVFEFKPQGEKSIKGAIPAHIMVVDSKGSAHGTLGVGKDKFTPENGRDILYCAQFFTNVPPCNVDAIYGKGVPVGVHRILHYKPSQEIQYLFQKNNNMNFDALAKRMNELSRYYIAHINTWKSKGFDISVQNSRGLPPINTYVNCANLINLALSNPEGFNFLPEHYRSQFI